MIDEGFAVSLGGRSWRLPHLPFRIIKTIQPALFKVYSDAADAGGGALAESQIDDLAHREIPGQSLNGGPEDRHLVPGSAVAGRFRRAPGESEVCS